MDWKTVPEVMDDLSRQKYHLATHMATTIWPTAMMNWEDQK